jgi:hypothetical protein
MWERQRQLLRPSTKNSGLNLVQKHNYELTNGFLRGSRLELWLFWGGWLGHDPEDGEEQHDFLWSTLGGASGSSFDPTSAFG